MGKKPGKSKSNKTAATAAGKCPNCGGDQSTKSGAFSGVASTYRECDVCHYVPTESVTPTK